MGIRHNSRVGVFCERHIKHAFDLLNAFIFDVGGVACGCAVLSFYGKHSGSHS